jgi:hypothetical protein
MDAILVRPNFAPGIGIGIGTRDSMYDKIKANVKNKAKNVILFVCSIN